jgi:hypothetical protein
MVLPDVFSPPTALQYEPPAVAQDTLVKSATPLVPRSLGFGLETIVQLPCQASTSVEVGVLTPSLKEPTAVQALSDVHDTASRTASGSPAPDRAGGLGLAK